VFNFFTFFFPETETETSFSIVLPPLQHGLGVYEVYIELFSSEIKVCNFSGEAFRVCEVILLRTDAENVFFKRFVEL